MTTPIAPARPLPSGRAASGTAASGEDDAVDELRDQEQVAEQREAFDFRIAERAEMEREANALRDLMLAQLKEDDDVLKKYIAMIA